MRDLHLAFRTEEGLLEVVRGVNLELRAGRTLAVVGKCGSGKSTLLRAIATLLNPEEVAVTGGTILIGGDPTDGLSPAQLRDLRSAQDRDSVSGRRERA